MNKTRGFTLVELLIVVAIIGLLLQLFLPAVEMSREAARRTSCHNNLRQIGLAAIAYESANGHYPTGGWGWGWIGDPDRGFGESQPGSWCYQLLPYLEQQNVYEIGKGLNGESKHRALTVLAATPIQLLYCPSRRLPRAFPNRYGPVEREGYNRGELFWYNAHKAKVLAKSDYVANEGDRWIFWHEGPSPEEADAGIGFFEFEDIEGSTEVDLNDVTGLVFQRKPVFIRQVTDGLSNTLFAGEKPIFVPDYKTGRSLNDDQSCWNGDDWDLVATTEFVPQPDPTGPVENFGIPFGGPHPDGVSLLFCDGSVRHIAFDIDAEVHRASGNRADGSVSQD